MNPEKELPDNQFNESTLDDPSAIDNFIKELEAKEKALDISPDLVLQIEESDINEAEALELLKFLDSCEENSAPPPPPPVAVKEPVSFSVNEKPSKTADDVKQLRQRVSKLELERTEMKELVRRQKNDFDNYRQRTERERNNIYSNVLSNMGTQLLPVIDNLGRALDANFSGEKSIEFQHFLDGIRLVNQQLYDVLGEMGIQPIKSVGEPFDPHFHEAVAAEQTNKFPPHTVIAEILRGFRLDDKIIRHSLVKVSTTANSEAALNEAADE